MSELNDDYRFVLEWDELDDELKEQKINSLIEFKFNNGEYEEDRSLDELLEDEEVREEAEYQIQSHFPIYF